MGINDQGKDPFETESLHSQEMQDTGRTTSASEHDERFSLHGARRIGPYELIDELGKGGFGRVYLAKNMSAEVPRRQEVAIKLLDLEPDDSDLRNFRDELNALESLSHPGIVSLVDSGVVSPTQAYLVMDYVDGIQIDEYCRVNELKWQAIVALLIQVCRSIEHAHSRGVLHCDLKPSNILVTNSNESVVTDFGLVRFFDETEDSYATVTAGIRGTPAYMAPEQLAPNKADRYERLSVAADVFGLGATLYKIISGEAPRPARSTISAVAMAVAGDPIPRLRHDRLVTDCPSGLLDIVEHATRITPEARYENVFQFREDLENLRAMQPLRARRLSLSKRFLLWTRREPFMAGVSILATVSILLCLAISFLWWRSEVRRSEDLRGGLTETLAVVQNVQSTLSRLRPGEPMSAENRIELLELVRDQYGSLVVLYPDDFELQYLYAQSCYILGAYLTELQHSKDAIAEINKAIPTFEKLTAKKYCLEKVQFDLFHSYHKIGYLYDRLDQRTASQRAFQKAENYIGKLWRNHRNNLDYADCYAAQLLATCKMDLLSESVDKKRERYRQVLEIATQLKQHPQSVPRHWRHRMSALHGLADLDLVDNDYDSARARLLKTIEFADQSLEAEPENWAHHIDKVSHSISLARQAAYFDDIELSIEILSESEDSFEWLVTHRSDLPATRIFGKERRSIRNALRQAGAVVAEE